MRTARRSSVAWARIACGTAIVSAACLAGCSQIRPDPLTPPDPPIVWPVPPDEPRVRMLGQLTGSEDVRAVKTVTEKWHELLYGPKPPDVFVKPHAVAVHPDGRRVAVADVGIGCVHRLDLENRRYAQLRQCGGENDGLATPVGVAWAGESLWVADAEKQAIAVFEPDRATGRWVGQGALQRPTGVAYCPDNELVYVTDARAHCVVAFDRRGNEIVRFGTHGPEPGQFNYPSQIAWGSGELVVTDTLNFRIQRFDASGTFLGMFGRLGDAAGDLSLPKGVAVDANGHIWVVDAHFENVQGFTPEGQLLMVFGREGSEPGEFWLPAGAFIDAQQRVWVADAGNRRVQVFELMMP